MSLDQERVVEARARLRSADQNPRRHDPAIRIVELDSPRPDDAPLTLHPRLAILAGLGEAAQQSLATTIDAIRVRNPNIGLTGRIESHGRRRPFSMLDRIEETPGAGLDSPDALVSAPEAGLYVQVADSAERAIQLSHAELRGTDERAREIDIQRSALTDSLAESSTALVSAGERSAMLAAIDEVLLPTEAVEQLQSRLDAVINDEQRVTLRGTVEQAEAAKSRVLPGDGNQAALLAELAIAEADGSLAAYDMIPGGAASKLHDQLQALGIEATADQAVSVSERVIAESRELRDMRFALNRELGQGSEPEDIDQAASLLDLRRELDELRMRIQRRLRAQQQLLAIAREAIAELSGLGNAARAEGDLSPVLVEEPLIDLPAELNGAVLSMLIRYSVHRQVICVSEQHLIEQWSTSVSPRAGWTEAQGWFSRRV